MLTLRLNFFFEFQGDICGRLKFHKSLLIFLCSIKILFYEQCFIPHLIFSAIFGNTFSPVNLDNLFYLLWKYSLLFYYSYELLFIFHPVFDLQILYFLFHLHIAIHYSYLFRKPLCIIYQIIWIVYHMCRHNNN